MKQGNLSQDTNSAIRLPLVSVWLETGLQRTQRKCFVWWRELPGALCSVRIDAGSWKLIWLEFAVKKDGWPSIHQRPWHMLLLPGQGVDTVMAYEGLCRPDTTSKCFGMDMSVQDSGKCSSKVYILFSSRKLKMLIESNSQKTVKTFPLWYQIICSSYWLQLPLAPSAGVRLFRPMNRSWQSSLSMLLYNGSKCLVTIFQWICWDFSQM